MQNTTLELSAVIPSYLEEENLRIILPRLVAILAELTTSYEVLIIDTQQPMDNTREVCNAHQHVRYINREGGNMYGDAVRTGIKEANGKYIVFLDADGSHSPEYIKNMFDIREQNDVIMASRYVEGGNTDNATSLVLMSWLVNSMYSIILDLPYKDISNSFKMYRSSLLKSLKLSCSNFDIIEEILYKLKKNNPQIKVKEIPFTFKERMFGHTKRNLLSFAFSYLFTLIRLRFIK
jgi:dolichol-phosphate mannosyltransferase